MVSIIIEKSCQTCPAYRTKLNEAARYDYNIPVMFYICSDLNKEIPESGCIIPQWCPRGKQTKDDKI